MICIIQIGRNVSLLLLLFLISENFVGKFFAASLVTAQLVNFLKKIPMKIERMVRRRMVRACTR